MAFAALPAVPQSGLNPWQFSFLNAAKQNIEELTGQGTATFRAIVAGQVTVATLSDMLTQPVSVSGEALDVSGTLVPLAEDFASLVTTVQYLIADMNETRSQLNALIEQLKRS